MKRNFLKLFVEELEKGEESRAYDFICQNAYLMSNATLADIIKECLCLDYALNNPTVSKSDIYLALADNLRKWHEDEIEESED